MRYTLSLSVVLFGVWLIWSGHFKPLLVMLGLLSCIAVVAVVRRMGPIDHETAPLSLLPGSLLYLPWLAKEVVTSNLDVARRILSPALPIRPSMVRVRAGQRTDLGRVIHANSITLTPGTVSVGVEGEEILVHALTAESAEAVQSGEMDRMVSRWEGRR